jgi:outer membrane immunogenic protein
MKRMVLLTAALALGGVAALPALAADPIEPYVYEPVAPAAGFDWSGVYFGGTLGVVNLNADVSDIEINGSPTPFPDYSTDVSGWLAGVTLGVNHQFDNFVVGIEADLSRSNAEGTYENVPANFSVTSYLDWFGTVRGRVGFAMDQALLYGTAGLATGTTKAVLSNVYGDDPPIVTTDEQSLWGWTVGAGGEFAVTENISLKAEALYYDLGDTTYTFDEQGGNDITADASVDGWIGRVGVNFRF